jgi:eukaryotic-like serine/threonine-protein kinase
VTPWRGSFEATLLDAAETLEGPPRFRRAKTAAPRPMSIGRYEVRSLLGEGAMGCVYRAFDPVRRVEVAVKTLKEPFASDPRVLERFRREADVVSRFAHPGLVAVDEVGEGYFVQEVVEGESLEARLERRGRLPPAEALPLLAPMGDALDHIHERGVVHRDLKPANVILTLGGGIKLADFGVACIAGTTPPGQMIGSPTYMAPEQIRLGEVGAASDLYALGVVAFEMLTGKPPFRSRAVGRLLESIVQDEPAAASVLFPFLPPAADAVLARALAKDPRARPSSGRAFARSLAIALASRRPPR